MRTFVVGFFRYFVACCVFIIESNRLEKGLRAGLDFDMEIFLAVFFFSVVFIVRTTYMYLDFHESKSFCLNGVAGISKEDEGSEIGFMLE